ncbi:putative transcriptional regulator [archaeon]|nr:putative transcriptional regulator [archaeon]
MEDYGFLTKRQMEVLGFRAQGYSQGEIAKLLGTSRENITIIDKRAREKVKKARTTIKIFESLEPVEITIPTSINLFSAPQFIFHAADRHEIRVRYNSTTVIGILRRKAGNCIVGNSVVEPIKIKILRSGHIVV